MTWLWILLFLVSCTAVIVGYVYVVEIRGSAPGDATADGSAGIEATVDRERIDASS